MEIDGYDIAWLAGLLEGEGSFIALQRTRQRGERGRS